MLEQGLLDETASVLKRGYDLNDPGLNTVGYKQAIGYLKGRISREQMVKEIKTKTRRYAKRQLSWFRRWDFVQWIDLGETTPADAQNFIRKQVAAKINKG